MPISIFPLANGHILLYVFECTASKFQVLLNPTLFFRPIFVTFSTHIQVRCQNPNFVFVPCSTLYKKTQSHFFGPTQLVSRGIHPNVHIIKPTSKVRHTFLEETNKCLQTFRPNFCKPFLVFFILLQLPLKILNPFALMQGTQIFFFLGTKTILFSATVNFTCTHDL